MEPKLDWSKEIKSLEDYFNQIKIPLATYDLKNGQTILDVKKFIESHLETLKKNNGNIVFSPYLDRLRSLKTTLTIKL